MTFEEWWKLLKPAECDEVKQYFEECWRISHDAALERAAEVCDAHTVEDAIVGVGISKSCAEMIRALKEE